MRHPEFSKVAGGLIQRDFHHFRCINSKNLVNSCGICQDVCPVNAIGFNGSEPRLASDCRGCGLCIAACPHGAFGDPFRIASSPTISLYYCSGLWPAGPDGQPWLSDSFIPCAGSVTLPTLIQRLLEHGPPIKIIVGDCASCQFKAGKSLFEEHQKILTEIADWLGLPRLSVMAVPASEQDLAAINESHARVRRKQEDDSKISRRELFSGFRRVFQPERRTVAEQATPATQAQGGEPLPGRELLKNYIRRHPTLGPDRGPSNYLQTITIDNTCRLCGLCARVCPSGALRMEQTTERLSLMKDAILCSNCGLCQQLCPRSAVRLAAGLSPQEILDGPVEARYLPLRTCSVCKRVFASESEETTCPSCRKNNQVMNDASHLIWGENLDEF